MRQAERKIFDPGQDAELLAYADGMLPPDRMQHVTATFARDPEAREAVEAWRNHAAVIREAAARADDLPANLAIAGLERQLARRLRVRRLRSLLTGPHLRSAAAGVMIFAAGWGVHALTDQPPIGALGYPAPVERALGGHLVYADSTAETRQFAADEVDLAVRLISDEFEYRFREAAFELPGYRIDAVRYTRYASGPAALFTYRDEAGRQATLAVERHPPGLPDYDLKVEPAAPGSIAYWTADALDYVVIASVDAEGMLPLIASIRDQGAW
ncbi:hypothetical protein KY389_11970 [Paracoccus bogoriensis]|uniref:anti-sigma factor family protein n=1 Tax=Paracoccus bogoriensis TaxID=242065 RepID=UPI001CA4DBC4|nr:hypothetical protein [Paracoccus bogoriensis]MBW7057401.1 hypothetical protein [Paracoccus bogoriensis]